MKQKALIVSIKGKKLSKRERILLSKEKPWGIILFKRNLKSFIQIKNLTSQIKLITKIIHLHFQILDMIQIQNFLQLMKVTAMFILVLLDIIIISLTINN